MDNKNLLLSISLGVSILFNGYIVYSSHQTIDRNTLLEQQNAQKALEEKAVEITTLEGRIKELEGQSNVTESDGTQEENNQEVDVTEPQDTTQSENIIVEDTSILSPFLEVTESFMHTYLDYTTDTMEERKVELLKYATQNVVDIIAPTVEGAVDPNFHSSINTMETYVLTDNSTTKKSVIVDVTYDVSGSEEVSTNTIHNLMNLVLEKSSDGIKVVDYETYAIR